MLNDAAKKLVARAARVAAQEKRGQISYGADVDVVAEQAWRDAQSLNPDFRNWPSAQRYFESIFLGELDYA